MEFSFLIFRNVGGKIRKRTEGGAETVRCRNGGKKTKHSVGCGGTTLWEVQWEQSQAARLPQLTG
jgi:hypothetical protein